MITSLLPYGDDIGKNPKHKGEVSPAECRAQRQKMARRRDNIIRGDQIATSRIGSFAGAKDVLMQGKFQTALPSLNFF